MQEVVLDTTRLAHAIVDLMAEKLAEDIVLLDMQKVSLLADYFIICTVGSQRQARTVQETIAQALKQEHNLLPLSIEGEPSSGWLLLDFGAVVIHVFDAETRAFYNLERLWREAAVVVKMQ